MPDNSTYIFMPLGIKIFLLTFHSILRSTYQLTNFFSFRTLTEAEMGKEGLALEPLSFQEMFKVWHCGLADGRLRKACFPAQV